MNNPKRKLLQQPSNTFGIQRLNKKIEKEDRKKPVPKRPVYEEPEKMNIIRPTLDKGHIELKQGENAILTSSFCDSNRNRIVKINTTDNFTTEFMDDYTTKITALTDIKGLITLSMPVEVISCDIQVDYMLKTGIFRLPENLNLSDDREDLSVTSVVLDGVEQLKQPIKWEVLNLYFIPPNDKICKYDYGEMINKAIGNTRISSCLDPDFVKYETECIQQFLWPSALNWCITVSNSDNEFMIDSQKLEDLKDDIPESKIIEWDNVFGQWESVWVRFNGEKTVKQFRGTWCEVVEQLVGDKCDIFSTGLIYDPSFNFTLCLRQGDVNHLFTNTV